MEIKYENVHTVKLPDLLTFKSQSCSNFMYLQVTTQKLTLQYVIIPISLQD